jgi:ABC-type multidrug transport system fused ATPase/permease subunit
MHELIMRLPDGYDTRVGQGGSNLSGGERHLIAIARAFLRDPRLLILDEATAAMDHFTEQQVQEGLRRLMAGRTCIVIAHRLSTLCHVDRIMVIDDGQVAESGTHEQLMAQGGIYHQLAVEQIERITRPSLESAAERLPV